MLLGVLLQIALLNSQTTVTVSEEEGNFIVSLQIRADELMRHLISGELTKYRVVRTSLEPLQQRER
jgi:hypothetical protein